MPRLRPPRNRVERRAVWWWLAQAAAFYVPAVVVLAVLAALIGPARPWLLLGLAVVAVVAVVDAGVAPWMRYRVHRWETTADAVYTLTGWFWHRWRVAPMSRIQTVDTVRGPLERRFRLATVTVTTASAKGALKIQGLDEERAAALAEELTAVTEATPGDAT